MNTKTKLIIGALAVAAVCFYAGIKYNQSHPAVSVATGRAAFAAGAGLRGGRGGAGGAVGGGFIMGSILSKDAQSITVSIQGGGSKIIYLASSTTFMKSVSATSNDLVVGQNVSVTGQSGTDGSVTARSIDLRDARN